MANILLEWCEIDYVLHEGKIESRRMRRAIDVMARVISWVQDTWTEGKIAGMQLMDVKGAFDYVS